MYETGVSECDGDSRDNVADRLRRKFDQQPGGALGARATRHNARERVGHYQSFGHRYDHAVNRDRAVVGRYHARRDLVLDLAASNTSVATISSSGMLSIVASGEMEARALYQGVTVLCILS